MSLADQIKFGTPPWTETGPDLGFLRLPDHTVAELQRHASILDGERHPGTAVAGEPDRAERVELVCGVVDEVTKTRVQGTQAVTTFTGLLNVGRVVKTSGIGNLRCRNRILTRNVNHNFVYLVESRVRVSNSHGRG
jgi:hypothetical protein